MMESPCRPLNIESFGHKMFIVSSLVSLHARFLLILLTRFIRFILLTRLYILLNDFDFIFCQNSQVLGCLGVAVENQSFSKVLVRIDGRVTRRNRHFVRPELVWSQNLITNTKNSEYSRKQYQYPVIIILSKCDNLK